MFCGKCGAKNEAGAKFCEKCGASLSGEKVETLDDKPTGGMPNQPIVKEKKPLSKQVKIIIAAVSAFVVLLIVFISVGTSMSNPNKVVEGYMKALATKDYDKLYTYLVDIENGDKTFVSKEAFKNSKKTVKDSEIEYLNYQVGRGTYGLGRLTYAAPVTYTYKGGSTEKTEEVVLQKSDKKNLLFFNKWELTSIYTDTKLINNYKITVPKDAEVTYSGIKVTSKYLDKNESTSANDVYVLSQVLPIQTPIKVTLKNGIEIEDTRTPSSYSDSYTARLSSSNISESMKEALVKKAKEDLTEIYGGVVANKKFNELNSKSFDSNLESSYNNYLSSLASSSRKLTKFEVSSVTYSSLSTTSEGYISLYARMNYNYSVSYTSSDEEKTHDDSSYDSVYLTYQMDGKSYKLRAVSSLPTYFSIY